jgi:hypothetical protein
VVLRATEKHPQNRYSSVAELRGQFQKAFKTTNPLNDGHAKHN